ncbi:MAG: hypothetical protein WCK78_13005 [Paludibacter sp.]
MTTTVDYNTFITIALLLGLMVALIFLMKYIVGDFSPVSIEEVGKDEVEMKDANGNVTGKKIVYTYKHTFKDGNVKYKTKTIKF